MNEGTPGRRRVVARALGVALLALIFALVPALSASADTASVLKDGSGHMCLNKDTKQCLVLAGTANASGDTRYFGLDIEAGDFSKFTAHTDSGDYPLGNGNLGVIECYLASNPSPHRQCANVGIYPGNVSGYPNIEGQNAHIGWVQDLTTDPSLAGVLCIGIYDATPGTTVFDPNRQSCGVALSQDNDGYADPNDYEIGHDWADGSKSGVKQTLPGQTKDGTIDIVQCMSDLLAKANGNPLDPQFLVGPFYCTFLWAFTPPTDFVNGLVDTESKVWAGTLPGKIIDQVDFFTDFSATDSDCSGLKVESSKLAIGGIHPDDMQLLAACPGSQLSPWASMVNIALTVAVLAGAVFKLITMISAFVKGPHIFGQSQEFTEGNQLL